MPGSRAGGGGGGGEGDRTHRLNNHKNIGFLGNTGSDPLKITKLPLASIQCWANGVSLAGR